MLKVAVVVLIAALLSGCGDDEALKDLQKAWEGAVVVKICKSGTYVYRLKDGRYKTGGFGAWVENPNTVCE